MISMTYMFLFSNILNFSKNQNIDLIIIYLMMFSSLIPIFAVAKQKKIIHRLASASSFSLKLSLIIIFYSFAINDWMIGSIGAFTLIVGDAGLIVLSLLYKEDLS